MVAVVVGVVGDDEVEVEVEFVDVDGDDDDDDVDVDKDEEDEDEGDEEDVEPVLVVLLVSSAAEREDAGAGFDLGHRRPSLCRLSDSSKVPALGDAGGVSTEWLLLLLLFCAFLPNLLSKESRDRYVSRALIRAAARPEAGCEL